VQNDIGYTGQRTDAGIGMVYMHGRYYNPQLARFISADPYVSDGLNPQALNRYSYVYNDPINNTDPTGYTPNDEITGGCEGEDCSTPPAETPPPVETPPPAETPPPVETPPPTEIDVTNVAPTTLNPVGNPNPLGFGLQVDLGEQFCIVSCFHLGDANFGVFLTPAQSNDILPFHDFHFFRGEGSSVLGLTRGPDQKLGFVDPDIFMAGIGRGWQSSLGLGIGGGGSIQIFITEAATPSDLSEWARVLSVSLGPASVSLGKNLNAQRTLAFGLGIGKSLPAGVSAYNTYTSVSAGGIAWLNQNIFSRLENGIQRLYGVNSLLGQ
jgi:RHS repeat-associated protein